MQNKVVKTSVGIMVAAILSLGGYTTITNQQFNDAREVKASDCILGIHDGDFMDLGAELEIYDRQIKDDGVGTSLNNLQIVKETDGALIPVCVTMKRE